MFAEIGRTFSYHTKPVLVGFMVFSFLFFTLGWLILETITFIGTIRRQIIWMRIYFTLPRTDRKNLPFWYPNHGEDDQDDEEPDNEELSTDYPSAEIVVSNVPPTDVEVLWRDIKTGKLYEFQGSEWIRFKEEWKCEDGTGEPCRCLQMNDCIYNQTSYKDD